ncbi:hypothetical protein ACFSQ3_04605 [Sphingobacterium corticis]|uniref:Uncharacterized protein n=1 Tax=Sphingobacterium corticis TaxID=1812823 RepID=A0ABW5NGI8_9SPHI
MENTKNEKSTLTNSLYLIGAVMAAIISFAASGNPLSLLTGAIGGLIFASLFVKFIIPHKPSDR